MKKNFRFLSVIFLLLFSYYSLFSAENPLEKAKSLFQSGKYEDAANICNKVKQTYPNSDWSLSAVMLLADIYEKTNKPENAVNEYKKIVSAYPDKPQAEEAYFSIARLRMLMKDGTGALEAYKEYIAKFPAGEHRVVALFNTAMIYKEKKNNPAALKYYNEILDNYTGDSWFYSWAAIYSGHIMFEKKNYNDALEYYGRVIKKPDNRSLSSLAELYKGLVYMQKKDYAAAETVYNSMLQASNYNAEEAMIGLASAHYKAKEYDMAKEVLDAFLETFPKSVWVDYVKKQLIRTEEHIDSPLKTGKEK